QQCSAGLSGNSCTGTLTPLVWSAALTYCKNLTLAGRSWRMPSANEIMTLADYTATNPAINLTYFPGTPAAENYWTSTTLPGTPANARHFFIQLGILHNMVKSAAIQIRCVANDL
ncbi:MAG TPA: DUF1566 domain-containing protein, partial [Turneriella sp.]|nr:DUF1566 domain-containing protein [Turneriella sp.]